MLAEYSQGKYSGAGNSGLRSPEVPAFRKCEVFQGQTPYITVIIEDA